MSFNTNMLRVGNERVSSEFILKRGSARGLNTNVNTNRYIICKLLNSDIIISNTLYDTGKPNNSQFRLNIILKIIPFTFIG